VLPGNHFSILDPDIPGSLTLETIKRHVLEAASVGANSPLPYDSIRSRETPLADSVSKRKDPLHTVVPALGAADHPALNLRIDDYKRLVRRDGSRLLTFGTIRSTAGSPAFAEGVHLRMTMENSASVPVFVSRIDLVIVMYDSSFVASYSQIPLPGLHHEIPNSDLPSVRLDDLADLEGRVTLGDRQFMLDASGQQGAHHSLNATVLATAPGLWRLSVVARYFFEDAPAQMMEVAASEELVVVKR
jgi:hypothetical protein